MGSTISLDMGKITQKIWNFVTSSNSWITVTNISCIWFGHHEDVDKEPKRQKKKTECKLSTKDFEYVIEQLSFIPPTDLFASWLNKRMSEFMSYRANPKCEVVHAFTQSWDGLEIYALPPFICIFKNWKDQVTGTFIAPTGQIKFDIIILSITDKRGFTFTYNGPSDIDDKLKSPSPNSSTLTFTGYINQSTLHTTLITWIGMELIIASWASKTNYNTYIT